MRAIYILIVISSFFIGYLICAIYYNNPIIFDYQKIQCTLDEIGIFLETIYFLIAIIVIPTAVFQYISDKKKEKRSVIEYTHKLYCIYVDEILKVDNELNSSYLNRLNERTKSDDILLFNDMLNKIDMFAAAFVYGLANIETAKKMMGSAYCSQINRYIPALERISSGNYREGFDNLFSLYDSWKDIDG